MALFAKYTNLGGACSSRREKHNMHTQPLKIWGSVRRFYFFEMHLYSYLSKTPLTDPEKVKTFKML